VQIERFDPVTDGRRLRACYEMTVAGHPEDDPNVPPPVYEDFRVWWALGESGSLVETWLATDDAGEPAGAYVAELPQHENRKNAFVQIIVAPSHRRRGAGRLLLAHLAGRVAEAGRDLLMGYTRTGAPGTAFAAATGGREGLTEVRRRQDLSEELFQRLPALRAAAQPHASGYSLRCWDGRAPSDLADSLCAVYTALGDAPHDEAFEPATFDTDRLRAEEERIVARGVRWYSVAALAADGEVAAVTQVNVHPGQSEWGWQAITAVRRHHRGHRLGLLVKIAMLELLAEREPALRHLVTYNSEPNQHMIAVNEQLGYQVTDEFKAWEHDVAAVLASLASEGAAGRPGQS
jgi:RimJ/RimL family protein N-acetyltransferase